MDKIARYGRVVAKPGCADELADRLLKAAADLDDDPGCELYLINREQDAPETLWVTELWRSREDLDRVVAELRKSSEPGEAMALAADWKMIELDLLGGKGPVPATERSAA